MNLVGRVAGITASQHAGRAMKLVRVLNLLGTVRGAITTVLLAASAVGGVATVNTVRQEIAEATPHPTKVPRASPTATATPLTAAALRADLERRLQERLAADAQAVDDLRKVASFSGPQLDQLIADAKQRLQARYDQGIAQLASLVPVPASPSPTEPASPAAASDVISANALFQVVTNDLSAIVVQTTRSVTGPTPVPRPVTVAPLRTPTPVPARTPTPTPSRSPLR